MSDAVHRIARRLSAEYQRAHCRPVPSLGCTCGLHAWNTVVDAWNHYGGSDRVLGAVLGWGRIVAHGSQGWRFQYAQPLALAKHDGINGIKGEYAELAAKTYGIPLVPMGMLESYALEFGERMPEAKG